MTTSNLITPYGGKLVDLMVKEQQAEIRREANDLPSLQVSDRAAAILRSWLPAGSRPLTVSWASMTTLRVGVHAATGRYSLSYSGDTTVRPCARRQSGRQDSPADSYNNLLAVMTIQEAHCWMLNVRRRLC